MSGQAQQPLTVDEFLAWDDGTDIRYELVDGIITAMNPPTPVHGELVARMVILLGRLVRPPCRPVSEAGIAVAERVFRQADIGVVCGPYHRDRATVEPRLVIEVLSPSTRKEDRTAKLDDYKSLPFIEEIWLLDSERRWLQAWVRVDGVWTGRDQVGGGSFFSPTLESEVRLDEIYGGLC
jgi:Uma2 family endonuclease